METEPKFNKITEQMMDEYFKAKTKLIKNYADELGISFKCAKYLIERNANFVVKENLNKPKSFYLTLEPKPIEELLAQEMVRCPECERELIEASKND